MSEKIKFEVESKNEDINPRQLRASGMLPATIYGKGVDSLSVQLDAHNFVNTYKKNKDSVYELSFDGKKYNTVVQNVQKNYATNQELNVEFKLVQLQTANKKAEKYFRFFLIKFPKKNRLSPDKSTTYQREELEREGFKGRLLFPYVYLVPDFCTN